MGNELCKLFYTKERSMKFVPGNDYSRCDNVAMHIVDEHSGFIISFFVLRIISYTVNIQASFFVYLQAIMAL